MVGFGTKNERMDIPRNNYNMFDMEFRVKLGRDKHVRSAFVMVIRVGVVK